MSHSNHPPVKVWLASAAITLAIVAVVARVAVVLWPQQSAGQTANLAEPIDIEASLQERSAVVSSEADWLSTVACPEGQRMSFNALKQEGMAARTVGDYASAERNFEDAFERCKAPEVLIALNNARIGNGNAYKLVVSVPYSGSNPNNAIEMLRGFAQAQQQVNESGGVNGVPLKLLVVDDGDREETAQSLAVALADDPAYEDVLGVVGHWTSDVSLAAAAVYRNRAALTFITPISTTKELTAYSRWVLRSTMNNRDGSRAMARYMLENWRLKKAAIFYVGGVTYSEEIRQEFAGVIKPAQEGEIVAEFDMAQKGFNADRSVKAAVDAGAEVILLATNNGSAGEAIAVIKANAGRLKVLGDLANLYSQETLQATDGAAAGLVMAIPWDIEGNPNTAFVKTSRDLWRGPVNYVTAMSYDAVLAMVSAMGAGDGSSPTRTSIQKALNDSNFSVRGASDVPLKFANGDRQGRVQLVEVVKVPGAAGEPDKLDFVPILSLSSDG